MDEIVNSSAAKELGGVSSAMNGVATFATGSDVLHKISRVTRMNIFCIKKTRIATWR